MSYTLKINFIGLFCFVPHEERNKLYVLLPTSRDTPHHHLPELKHRKLTNPSHLFGSEHVALTGIPDRGGTTIKVPSEACNLEEVTGHKLPRSQIEDTPTDRVRLRIELPPADLIVPGDTAEWHIVRRRPLTHEITWIRNGLTLPEIQFVRKTFGGTSRPTLRFIPQASTVEFFFRHLPHHTRCIKKEEEAPHFSLYYSLYRAGSTGPNPILKEDPPFPCFPAHKRIRPGLRKRFFTDSTYTCMTAHAPI